MPTTLLTPASNFVELLQRYSAVKPHHTPFLFLKNGETEPDRLTLGDIDLQARIIAGWLQQQNTAQQPVLLACPTGPEFVTGFFGCLYAGAIPVPIPPPTQPRWRPRAAAIAAHAGASIALTSTAPLHAWNGPTLHWQPIDSIRPDSGAAWRPCPTAPETLALLQYTSGSTGQPKGIKLSHANLLANLAQICTACRLSSADIGVFWLPLYHDMGLIGSILSPIYLTATAVLMAPTAFTERPARWLEALSRYQGTISVAPDFAYALCTERITAAEGAQLDLRSWRVALCGSEPVRATTLERFSHTFAACGFRATSLRPTYGLAEATLIVSVHQEPESGADSQSTSPKRSSANAAAAPPLVSCGTPVAGVKVRIVDPNTATQMPEGQIGELWVQGPNVAQGYWQDAAATHTTFEALLRDSGEGAFLSTGDLGCLQDGQLFIAGRLKNLILAGGENYYAEDIEKSVLQETSTAVALAAAFAVDIDDRQKIVLLLERHRNWRHGHDPVALAALAQRARQTIRNSLGLEIDDVVVLRPAALPRTSSGKRQHTHYAALYLASTLPGIEYHLPTPSAHPATDLLETEIWALDWLAKLTNTPASQLDLQQPFHSLGLGSLQTALLLARLHTELGIVVPPAALNPDASLGELVALISAASPHKTS